MGEGGLRRALVWRGFWGSILGPSLGSKMGAKFINFWVQLQTFFLGLLELLGCLLGAFLGLLRLSWEASGPQKHQKIEGFLRFLKMQLFGSLELLMALLGSSCPLLGPIWSQNGPQNGPKSGPKTAQKMSPKRLPKELEMGQDGPKNAPLAL